MVVTPAEAGVQEVPDSRIGGNDGVEGAAGLRSALGALSERGQS